MRKKPTRKRPYFKMESAMTAILRDASGKMHHGILFVPPLGRLGSTAIGIRIRVRLIFLIRPLQTLLLRLFNFPLCYLLRAKQPLLVIESEANPSERYSFTVAQLY